jgi:predicted RNA binding protein YcfA (HicA-like mRNA interferase family)
MTPKDVIARLRDEGWVEKGKGDHVQYAHPNRSGRVTIDMGARDIPIGTLKSIFKQAGWEWK